MTYQELKEAVERIHFVYSPYFLEFLREDQLNALILFKVDDLTVQELLHPQEFSYRWAQDLLGTWDPKTYMYMPYNGKLRRHPMKHPDGSTILQNIKCRDDFLPAIDHVETYILSYLNALCPIRE